MEFDSNSEFCEIALPLGKKLMRLRERDFAKADAIAGAKLGRDWKIDRDHVRDFRITANGLAISKQNNWFAARRHLNRSWHNRFGDQVHAARRGGSRDIVSSFQLRTIEPRGHSIRLGGDGKSFIRELLNRFIVEAVPINAANEAQDRIVLSRAYPIMRRAPRRNSRCSGGRRPRSSCKQKNIAVT